LLVRFLVLFAALMFVAVPAGASVPRLVAPEVNAECATALRIVERARLYLPGNFGFHCPDYSGGHLGRSVFNGSSGWVELNTDAIRFYGLHAEDVMAHETCHAWQQSTTGTTTEESADACASARGFDTGELRPRPVLVAP
jgi:hypothetical protein